MQFMWSTSPIANKVKITQYSARITQEGHHTMSEKINEQIECCDCNEIHEDLLKIVNDTMPEETELYDLAELFKVFGDSTRIRILFVLFEAEVCVCDLADRKSTRLNSSHSSQSRMPSSA